MVKKFIEVNHAQSRPRTRDEQERLLAKHFLKKYNDVPLNRITTKDILSVTDALKTYGAVPGLVGIGGGVISGLT